MAAIIHPSHFFVTSVIRRLVLMHVIVSHFLSLSCHCFAHAHLCRNLLRNARRTPAWRDTTVHRYGAKVCHGPRRALLHTKWIFTVSTVEGGSSAVESLNDELDEPGVPAG